MVIRGGITFFSLREIAGSSPFSADYLRIRILQKKLRGVKFGREWYTTREWLADYLGRYAQKSKRIHVAEVADVAAVTVPARVVSPDVPTSGIPEIRGIERLEPARAAAGEPPERIRSRHDFRAFSRELRAFFPPQLALVPLGAALAFAFVFAVSVAELTPRDMAPVIGRAGSALARIPDLTKTSGDYAALAVRHRFGALRSSVSGMLRQFGHEIAASAGRPAGVRSLPERALRGLAVRSYAAARSAVSDSLDRVAPAWRGAFSGAGGGVSTFF